MIYVNIVLYYDFVIPFVHLVILEFQYFLSKKMYNLENSFDTAKVGLLFQHEDLFYRNYCTQ